MTSLQRSRHKGFSIIELLVSMAIGLVVTLIIYQVVSTFEGIKRTTTSGSSTQINGAFSLTAIERDIRGSGWGMPTADIMPCTVFLTYYDNGIASGPVPNFPQTPVRIVDGGAAAGASDSITMLWGSSVRSNVKNPLLQTVTLNPGSDVMADLQATTGAGQSQLGGFVWLTDDAQNCALARITAVTPGPILDHTPTAPSSAQPNYNAPDTYIAAQGWKNTFDTNPRIYDAGALTQRTYSVVNGSLASQDFFSTTDNVVLANNIVGLKAQYGISDAGSQAVSDWVSATNSGGVNWAAPTANQFKRIKAIRLAIVARSPLRERPPTPGAACTTTTVAPTTWPGGPAVDLSGDPDWQCYRYRVFQTVVPLRNVLWANLT